MRAGVVAEHEKRESTLELETISDTFGNVEGPNGIRCRLVGFESAGCLDGEVILKHNEKQLGQGHLVTYLIEG